MQMNICSFLNLHIYFIMERPMEGLFFSLTTIKPITDIHRTEYQEKENQIVFTKYVTTFHTKQSKHQLVYYSR